MEKSLPGPLMLLVALIQGLLMFVLYRALETEQWPYEEPLWLTPMIALLVTAPLFFLLLVDHTNQQQTLKYLLPFAVVTALISTYTGLQMEPLEQVRSNPVILSFGLSFLIVCFKALMYSQESIQERPVSYTSLFHFSWRNFLTLALSLLFVLMFIGILKLWGALFDLIDIGLFSSLFEQEWFLFPAATTALAFAIIIFRSLSGIIDSITKLLQALIKFLLPLVSLIALIFLASLLLSGVSPLWQTSLGSGLVLWLQALLLFFTNAVYQADKEPPYPLNLHRMIGISLAILPAYSLIAFYGLFTRISQYGLTLQRSWAVLVAVLLFLFACGYLWGILQRRDRWLEQLARVNIRIGVVVMLTMILVNTPLLNFQSLSANSQLARLQRGDITVQQLDLDYLRHNLGRSGYLALRDIRQEYAGQYPGIAARIDALYADPSLPVTLSAEQLQESITLWPEDREIPEDLLTAMLETANQPTGGGLNVSYAAVFTNLNQTPGEEVVLVRQYAGGPAYLTLWYIADNRWQQLDLSPVFNGGDFDIGQILAQDQIEVQDPQWRELRLGEITVQIPTGSQAGRFPGALPVNRLQN